MFVAIEPSGRKDVRFFPARQIKSLTLLSGVQKADFFDPKAAAALHDLQAKIENPIKATLRYIDYALLRKLLEQFAEEQQRLRVSGESSEAISAAADLLRAYRELIKELERKKLLDILLENQTEIRENLSFDTLPALDGQVIPAETLSRLIAEARESRNFGESDGGRVYLNRLSEEMIIAALKSNRPEEVKKPDRVGHFMRITAAIGKIAVGGSLAAANVGLGLFAGVVSALPTLGVGTVAAAIGVVTSAYTGLNAGCDGLKDLSNATGDK
jgi:cob(I)alamin adenosyltransferase